MFEPWPIVRPLLPDASTALGREKPVPLSPVTYRQVRPAQSGAAGDAALWTRFVERAQALGTTVRGVADERAAVEAIIRDAPGAVAARSLAERFPGGAAQLSPAPAAPATAEVVVCPAELAVAETGSLLVALPNADRAAAFLARQLWLLVRVEQITPTLDEALQHVARLVRSGNPYLTLMSGPSRTADIERTLTIGVHGPGALHAVVVGGQPGRP